MHVTTPGQALIKCYLGRLAAEPNRSHVCMMPWLHDNLGLLAGIYHLGWDVGFVSLFVGAGASGCKYCSLA